MHHFPTPTGWKQNLIRKPNEMLHFMPDAQNQYLFTERNKITLVICWHILFFMDLSILENENNRIQDCYDDCY